MDGESVRAASAANRDTPDSAPCPSQDCRTVIHISVFFDGTGNNDETDSAASQWSNIARLYHSAQIAAANDTSRTTYPIYISGVGTKFNGKATNWLSTAAGWVEDRLPGLGAGAGGDRRMEHGRDSVNDRLRDVLIANANMLGGAAAKFAVENSNSTFAEVNKVVAGHRLIKVINLSLFGFSRGAALARAFSNRVITNCNRRENTLLYDGYPLRLNFMGLFDTVASFGVPAQNARTPFTERELIVSAAVERCVHYVAAHEVRFSFPVDLIRKKGNLEQGWVEKAYPGVHSDVGGGYSPTDQGVDDNFARIPLRDMMTVSLSSGVRMLGYEALRKTRFTVFSQRFECRPETDAAYTHYLACSASAAGTIEEEIGNHLKLYYSAHGTMHRRGMQTAGDRSRAAARYKNVIGSKGMAHEVRAYRSLEKAGRWLRLGETGARGFAQYVRIREWQLAAWDTDASNGAVEFVSKYIHDSKVDFMGNIEPFSYFRPRGVHESTISVWQEGGEWIRNKSRSAVQAVVDTVEKGKEIGAEVTPPYEAAAEKIYESGSRWVRQRLKGDFEA